MRRLLGIAAGLATQAFFAVTVWFLFWFLKGDVGNDFERGRLGLDAVLALQFAVLHSMLLHPRMRQWLRRWIRPEFYGLFFCASTCGSLLLAIGLWQRNTSLQWRLEGPAAAVATGAFFASWAALFYSLWLSGIGYQTGLTPWWHWLRRRPLTRRRFRPRGLYHWFRHPVYLSFLGLLWFTPMVTADRLVLVGVWTAYVAVGSWLKDRRLEHYLGRRYRIYESLVPGYPFVPGGPLGRIPLDKLRTVRFSSRRPAASSQPASRPAA